MALVTGTLSDFGLEPMTSLEPEIIFRPSDVGVVSGRLLATKPIRVRPFTSGYFQVELTSTDYVEPASWYTVEIRWLDFEGGYAAVDFVDWKLFVPQEGGAIGDLLESPVNPAMVYVSLTPPTAGSLPRGTWWLESNPDNIDDPANTGILYEWSS